MQGGLPTRLSWNSPDINTNSLLPLQLTPAATVNVRNLSTVASAANVRVDVSVFRFGIGFERALFGGTLLSLGPSAQATFEAPFPQSVLTGEQRVGIEVRITHPTDTNAGNNIGLQAVEFLLTSDVGKAFSVAFPVRNPSEGAQAISIQAGPVDAGLTVTVPSPGTAFGPFEERLLTSDFTVAPGMATITREATFIAFSGAGELIDGVTFSVNVDS